MLVRLRQFFVRRPLWQTLPVLMALSVASSVGMLFLLTELMNLGYPPSFRRSLMVASIAPLLVSGPIGGMVILLLRQVEQARQRAQQLAWEDDLTGLLNRRRFAELGERERRLAHRQGTSLSLVLLDVDNFKHINDRHGHSGGDAVLQAMGRVLRESSRSTDIVGRWGGEEFVLLLPGAAGAGALHVTERVRETVAQQVIVSAGQALRWTVSVGVAQLRPDESFESLVRRADQAMYRAKAEGKNRVCAAEAA
jgi:diguanylate cyclase (GGDEF)-like protein